MPSRDINDADPRLQSLFKALSERFSLWFPGWKLILTCSYRSPAEQLVEFKAGRSRLDGTIKIGKHNYKPSRAIDFMIVAPEGVLIDNQLKQGKVSKEQHRAMYGIVGMWAQMLGFRSGIDWDGDQLHVDPDPDESLDDPYHVELP